MPLGINMWYKMTKVCLGPLQKPLEVLLYPKPKFRKVIFL